MTQGTKKPGGPMARVEYPRVVEVQGSNNELDIETYTRELGLDLEELSADEQFVLYLAKKAHFVLDDIQLKRSAVFRDDERDSPIPADNMDVGIVESPEEAASALSSEWAMEEVAPELFYKKLLAGETLKREWRETYRKPIPATGDEKQYTHVLIDVSGSMDSSDGRGDMARALAIAFLKKGYDEGAQFLLRPFAGSPQRLLKGEEQHELTDIVRTLLRLPMDGSGTDIQEALEKAVADIEADGEFGKADLLLLTDGESHMGDNPLGKTDLHTIIVGADDYSKELEEWSETFRRIVPQGEPNLAANEEDVEDAQDALQALKEGLEKLTDAREIENFKEKLRKKRELLKKMKSLASDKNEQGEKLDELINEINKMVNRDSASAAQKNKEAKEERDREAKQKKKMSDEAIKELRKKIAKMQGKDIGEDPFDQNEDAEQTQDDVQGNQPGGEEKGQGGEKQEGNQEEGQSDQEQDRDEGDEKGQGDKEKGPNQGEKCQGGECDQPQEFDQKKEENPEEQKQEDGEKDKDDGKGKAQGTGKWRFVQKAYRWVRKHVWKR